MKEKIILFTRVPKAGTTKTRLYDFITPEVAAKLQEKLLKKNYNLLLRAAKELLVFHDGTKADDSHMRTLIAQDKFYYQHGRTLGDKMYNAFNEVFFEESKVILLGSDIFNLDKEMITTAFKKLDDVDVVINPSEDGGYFLIGMKRPIKEVFDLPSYGDNTVLENLLRVIKDNKLSYYLGKPALDIDTKEDLLFAETGYKNIKLLGAGEYNINFTFDEKNVKKVLRMNIKSQMNLKNQMSYEFETLELLKVSSVTPKPFKLVTKTEILPYNYLTMEFLPGRALDYKKDMQIASYLLSKVHNTKFGKSSLIKATNPFQLMYDECKTMATSYLTWQSADEIVKNYLETFLAVAKKKIPKEYEVNRPCIINTELNSGNFLIGSGKNDSYIIDWEKALVGECEQDLGHFLAPTTTFWKTDVVLTLQEIEAFLEDYEQYRKIEREKFERYLIFNCLRGVTWCSMAYREYSESTKLLTDDFTFKKISAYLTIDFLEKVSAYFKE